MAKNKKLNEDLIIQEEQIIDESVQGEPVINETVKSPTQETIKEVKQINGVLSGNSVAEIQSIVKKLL